MYRQSGFRPSAFGFQALVPNFDDMSQGRWSPNLQRGNHMTLPRIAVSIFGALLVVVGCGKKSPPSTATPAASAVAADSAAVKQRAPAPAGSPAPVAAPAQV